MADPVAAVASAAYINLTTFRRDGREVSTPVWVVQLDGRLFGFTNIITGKAKRMRATGKMRCAPSTMGGRITGDSVDGQARVVDDPALTRRVFAALAKKYGWQYWLIRGGYALAGKRKGWVPFEIMPAAAQN